MGSVLGLPAFQGEHQAWESLVHRRVSEESPGFMSTGLGLVCPIVSCRAFAGLEPGIYGEDVIPCPHVKSGEVNVLLEIVSLTAWEYIQEGS